MHFLISVYSAKDRIRYENICIDDKMGVPFYTYIPVRPGHTVYEYTLLLEYFALLRDVLTTVGVSTVLRIAQYWVEPVFNFFWINYLSYGLG